LIENNEASASEGDHVTETKSTAEKESKDEKSVDDDTETKSPAEKKAEEELLASPLM
jgi:hypothetical protein